MRTSFIFALNVLFQNDFLFVSFRLKPKNAVRLKGVTMQAVILATGCMRIKWIYLNTTFEENIQSFAVSCVDFTM